MDNTVKKNSLKRILSLLIAFTLVIGFFAFDSSKASAASSVDSTKGVPVGSTIYFGSYPQSDLGVDIPTGVSSDKYVNIENENAEGSAYEDWKRYFGIEPIEWRVVENNSGELLLVSNQILDAAVYDGASSPNWETSDLRSWLNDRSETTPAGEEAFLYSNFFDNAFSASEQPGVKSSDRNNGDNLGAATTDNVFLLTEAQVNSLSSVLGDVKGTNSEYVYRYKGRQGGFESTGLSNDSWMGMPLTSSQGPTVVVDAYGTVFNNKGSSAEREGVRPAIILDTNNVVMVSEIGAKSGAIGLDTPAPLTGNLKLTVASSALSLNVTNLSTVAAADQTAGLSIAYTGASTGSGKYLSAVLEQDGDLKHYGKIKDLSNAADVAGTATLPLTSVGLGDYTLKIFVEEEQAGVATDLASAVKRVSLSVTNTPSTPPVITTNATLPVGSKNIAYSTDIVATGSPTPVLALKSGSTLPPGLTFNQNGDSDNKIKGIPTAGGSDTFTVTATGLDASNSEVVVEKVFTLVISDTRPPTLPTVTALPIGYIGQSYTHKVESNAAPEAVISVTDGSLPAGLNVAADGTITGTPTLEGNYTFELTAVNAHGTDDKIYTIEVKDLTQNEAPLITTASLGDGAAGYDYSQTITATGYPVPSIRLPSGNESWLEIVDNGNGTATLKSKAGNAPAAAGNYNVTIVAENRHNGTDYDNVKTFTLAIKSSAVPPAIGETSLPDAVVGNSYSKSLAVTGAPTPSVTVSGNLPNGLTLSGDVISGTPTQTGVFNFTVTATSAAGTATQAFTITVGEKPVFTTTTLPGAVVGTSYNQKVIVTCTPAPIITLKSGVLPAGLSLASDGTISGTPTAVENCAFQLEATNAVGKANTTLTIAVAPEGTVVVPPTNETPAISYAPNPMKFDLNTNVKTGTVGVSLGMSNNIKVADTAEITLANNMVSIDNALLMNDGIVNVAALRVGTDTITVTFKDAAGNVLPYTQTISVIVENSRSSVVGGGSSGGGGGGGSVGGGGNVTADSSPHAGTGKGSTTNVNTLWDKVVASVPGAVTTAKADNRDTAVIRVKDGKVLTVARAKQIADSATKNKGSVMLNLDNMGKNVVLTRMQVDTSNVDKDINLETKINSDSVKKFATFFSNETTGFSFLHKDKLCQIVKVAVKLDLSEFDTNNLVIYSYNPQTNKYAKLSNQDYRIDANGYLHFETDLLHDIIVSNGELVRK